MDKTDTQKILNEIIKERGDSVSIMFLHDNIFMYDQYVLLRKILKTCFDLDIPEDNSEVIPMIAVEGLTDLYIDTNAFCQILEMNMIEFNGHVVYFKKRGGGCFPNVKKQDQIKKSFKFDLGTKHKSNKNKSYFKFTECLDFHENWFIPEYLEKRKIKSSKSKNKEVKNNLDNRNVILVKTEKKKMQVKVLFEQNLDFPSKIISGSNNSLRIDFQKIMDICSDYYDADAVGPRMSLIRINGNKFVLRIVVDFDPNKDEEYKEFQRLKDKFSKVKILDN